MPYQATKDEQIMVESDKMQSTGGGNGKPPQYTCHENLLNYTKRQKDMTPDNDPTRLVGVQYATGEEWGDSS